MQVQGNFDPAVSVDQFKRSRHILPDDVTDDVLFESLLVSAQDVVETGTNRPLTRRVVQIETRVGLGCRWYFPCAPVADITALAFQDSDGMWQNLPLDGVVLQRAFDEPQLVFPAGFASDAPDGAPLRVTANVGHDVVPRPLAQGIILVAADWYEAGIDPDKDKHTKVTFGARALMKQRRYRRPMEWARV